jgi:hypothetical protein
MLSIQCKSFADVRTILAAKILEAPKVRTERWQGVDATKNPALVSYELRNVEIEVPLQGDVDLDYWRADIRPNLPWADDHFKERVCGEPLNPGEQWKNWPWANSADRHRLENQRFNHTYMERLWPKWAGMAFDHVVQYGVRRMPGGRQMPRQGINGNYGDLQDLVELLANEPYTRQAWIPLFFPEDTGRGDGGRKPCTLGYQVLVRDDGDGARAHIWYPLRSCDLIRHWADDCYMAVRLLLWIIMQCQIRRPDLWTGVLPGTYAMHCTSLHIFENDMIGLKRGAP